VLDAVLSGGKGMGFGGGVSLNVSSRLYRALVETRLASDAGSGYGLSRDPARWDAPTQALMMRLAQEHSRIWFAYDDAVDAPNPMRDWMQENWQPGQRLTFEDGVTLVLYATR
jgi:hypothetical protein